MGDLLLFLEKFLRIFEDSLRKFGEIGSLLEDNELTISNHFCCFWPAREAVNSSQIYASSHYSTPVHTTLIGDHFALQCGERRRELWSLWRGRRRPQSGRQWTGTALQQYERGVRSRRLRNQRATPSSSWSHPSRLGTRRMNF